MASCIFVIFYEEKERERESESERDCQVDTERGRDA